MATKPQNGDSDTPEATPRFREECCESDSHSTHVPCAPRAAHYECADQPGPGPAAVEESGEGEPGGCQTSPSAPAVVLCGPPAAASAWLRNSLRHQVERLEALSRAALRQADHPTIGAVSNQLAGVYADAAAVFRAALEDA